MNASNPLTGGGANSTLASAVTKVKRHILPIFVILLIVNYLDCVNIGFVHSQLEYHMGFGAAAYGFAAGLFFIGHVLFGESTTRLLQKVSTGICRTPIVRTRRIVATCIAFVDPETPLKICNMPTEPGATSAAHS